MTSLGIDIGGNSVKLAMMDGSGLLWTGQSQPYRRPDRFGLLAAIQQAAAGRPLAAANVGICLPGLVDAVTNRVTASVNVPGLIGLSPAELVNEFGGPRAGAASARILTDAHATAHDIWLQTGRPTARLLVLCLGAGVGAAVLDNGQPLAVDGPSPGHIGQMDVGLADSPVIGPDGGAGGLEGYLGAAALRRTYGDDLWPAIAAWQGDEPPLRALARAIRICHAIYRPQHIYVAGGIGIRLTHLLPQLMAMVATNLTSIVRPGWTLACASSLFHAARGAAELCRG